MANNIRKTALNLLVSYEKEAKYVNLLLSSPSLASLSSEERSALTSLLYTTVENKLKYDYLIAKYAKRPASDIDMYVLCALRLGMCQILDMKSIPNFAAVNETVKLARHKGESGFINAILRCAVRDKDSLPLPDRKKNELRYFSIFYSVPYATVKLFARLFGNSECEELLFAFSSTPALGLTVNEGKISRDELLIKLSDFSAKRSKYTENGIELEKSVPPKSLPGFEGGEFFVQDEASRILAATLAPEVGDTVVDVCSAPGGKSLAAAIKVGKDGKVYSFDLHESKLSLILSSAERLGLGNIEVKAVDATVGASELFGKADRVICDVPCSGLGVFAKKPDLRYKDISTFDELPPLQYAILEKSAEYLKVGGIMTYSTCTLNPEENELITDRFISEHPEFTYEGIKLSCLSSDKGITLLPHKHGTDGFYIAKLRKNK